MTRGAVADRSLRELHSGLLRSADAFPERPALEVAGERLSYAELRDRAAAVAATLTREGPAGEPALTAVFAYRTPTCYVGLLGALLRGHGYVPLNRTFPPDRTRLMLQTAGCRALVADAESAGQLEQALAGLDEPRLILLPDVADVDDLARRLPNHRLLGARDLEPAASWQREPVDPNAIAYLLFTSGSTGVPKGVMVAHRNVAHLVDTLAERHGITEEDRFSQVNEVTFDMSVQDLFVAWERGACVCCPDRKTLIKPGRWIRETGITVWYSVPSTAIFMRRLAALKPGSYPSLRWSLFAGEPLPVEVAAAWQDAAPNSVVENLFGPTELTVVCIGYQWDPELSSAESERGGVPMGTPLGNNKPLVVDEELHEVAPGEEGELLVGGPQVALGYWQDEAKTARAFVVPPGHGDVHYRTGDHVRNPLPGRPMTYLGRMDQQIQIFGERVELGEVEAAVREESGVDAVVAVGWPLTPTGASGVEVFVGDETVDSTRLEAQLRERLPTHMAPRRVHVLADLPLNANGKFDRPALLSSLEERGASSG